MPGMDDGSPRLPRGSSPPDPTWSLSRNSLGRRRSPGGDQATSSAAARDAYVFCPTVTRGEDTMPRLCEHAGRSRWCAAAFLPQPGGWWPSRAPRSGPDHRRSRRIIISPTHLGARTTERRLQMEAAHGPSGWSRAPGRDVILCGDFTPRPVPRLPLAPGLRDASQPEGPHPVRTFIRPNPLPGSTTYLHLRRVRAREIRVPRTRFTRVASDHFPARRGTLPLAPPTAERQTAHHHDRESIENEHGEAERVSSPLHPPKITRSPTAAKLIGNRRHRRGERHTHHREHVVLRNVGRTGQETG